MNSLTSTSFTAFIGIDWADTKHDVCLQASNNDKREFSVIPHHVGRIEQWAHAVHERFGGTIAIAIELSKGPIVYALQKYDFLSYFQSIRRRWQNIEKLLNPVGPKMIRPMLNSRWIL